MAVDFSIVIPVYNSTASLGKLAEEIQDAFRTELPGETFEVIMVDDASPNAHTWTAVKKVSSDHGFVKGFRLMKNKGKTGALICGFEQAKGEYIITMDDDLQHPPAEIPKLVARKGHDVVIGKFPDRKHKKWKQWLSNWKGKLDERLVGKPKGLKFGPFMMLKKVVVEEMLKIRTPYPYFPSLIFHTTTDAVNVDVEHRHRKFGNSNFTLWKMLRLMSNLLINNSAILLRTISIIGILFAIVSFGLAIYFFLKKILVGIPVAGWASTIILILLIGGIMVFSIGIIGEYLIRIIHGLEQRPPYVIRDRTDKG